MADHTDGAEAYVSRYTIDIEIMIVVTEHRYSKGNVPSGAEVTYGDGIKTLSVLLSTEGIIAEERLSDFFSEITRGTITISDGTIDNYLSELSKKLDPELEAIETSLLNKPVMHVDDTPTRCTQKPEYSGDGEPTMKISEGTSLSVYIRTHSSDTETLYTVNPRKNEEGIERDGILPKYIGTIVQDHEAKFFNYGTANGSCGGHLCRELRGLHELQKIPWAEKMRQFMNGMNNHKNADLQADRTSCDPDDLLAFERSYDELIGKGRTALSVLKEKELGQDELRRMLDRLTNSKDNYLLFIRDYKVPFTNNLAERDLRPVKTKQKVSGCFRSWAGAKRYTRIRSFISTLKKRKVGLFESISSVLSGLRVIGANK